METEIDVDRVRGLQYLDAALVDAARRLDVFTFEPGAIVAERAAAEALARARAATVDSTDVEVQHRRIVGPVGEPLHVRVYRARGETLPLVLYAHGGGFVTGDLDTDHRHCVELARDAACAVVSVEYRLAPEHRCPAALDDIETALYDVLQHAEDLRLDPSRVAVMGRDAGAALAAGLAHRVFDANGPRIALQVLHHPMLDCDTAGSRRQFLRTPGMTGAAAALGWEHYLGRTRPSARSVPAYRTNLEGLPRALISCAEIDPCRDEAINYATRLLRAGVHTDLHVPSATFHGFDSDVPDWQVSRDVRRLHAQAIVRAFQAI